MGDPQDASSSDSVASNDTIAASDTAAEVRRTRRSRANESARPDHGELPTIDPDNYVFASEIARGGMGRISVARDLRLGRDVAVKEVLADSDDLTRRFEREVRITARLQHPSIVSIHEAGRWPTGEPFYAMKLVSGRSLQDIIATTPTLDGRLASIPSVLAVADAMAYAHRERVIHRDLKPHNVIVGEFGETVVIDWGLAKQLDTPDLATSGEHAPQPGQTSAGEVLGTLAYMPPEQATGETVDERADVYAIGAILYHVLAGRPPFAAPSFAELLAKVHDETPPPIVSIEPDAPADLIAIAEHAMARDRKARYRTARELADDLRRFQTGQLVGAHRYSPRELLWRWARRHRGVLAAAAIAIAVIAVGGTLAVRRIMASESRAEDQSQLATRNQADAEQLTQFMLVDLHKRLRDLGRLDLLDSAARRAASYYDTHEATSDGDQLSAATAREQIAEIMTAKGDSDAARVQMERGNTLARALMARRPDLVGPAVVAIETAILIGRDQLVRGDSTAALASFRDADAMAQLNRTRHPSARDALFAKARAVEAIAGVLDTRGDRDGALVAARQALAVHDELPATPDPDADRLLIDVRSYIGTLLLGKRDIDGALAEFRASLAIGERASEREPRSLAWAYDVSANHHDIGEALLAKGDVDGALAEYRASLEINQRLVSIDPANVRWQNLLSMSHESIGAILTTRHDLPGATAELLAALAIDVALVAHNRADTSLRRNLSVMYNKVGDLQATANDVVSALASYRAGLVVREELQRIDPTNAGWSRDRFYSHFRIASFLDRLHLITPTIDELRAARDIAIGKATHAPDDESAQIDLARTRAALGGFLMETNEPDAARIEFEAARTIAERMRAKPHTERMWPGLAKAMTEAIDHSRKRR